MAPYDGMLASTQPPDLATHRPDISEPAVRRVVALACRAPSVHNTQPWAWRPRRGGLDLLADRRRSLPVADPDGRNLVISCGAALHHAQVVARACGWGVTVDRLPDPADPDLLARLEFFPMPPPPGATALLEIVQSRCTDRRRFTSWPMPVERLEKLAQLAEEWDALAVAVGDVGDKFRLDLLIVRAQRLQGQDEAVAAELRAWIDRRDGVGVPSEAVPDRPGPDESHLSRFGVGHLEDAGRELEGTDGLIVLGSVDDSPLGWLRCGEGLSALWLKAAGEGLTVVPLSQVIEVPETRDALRHEVLHGAMTPLLVVRVGWQAISRHLLPPTPRRPLEEVLVP